MATETEGLVVVAIPKDQYDTIVETLAMDADSSAFDRELRAEIDQARRAICEITHEVKEFLAAAQRTAVDTGPSGEYERTLALLQDRLALATVPNLVLDDGDDEDEEEDE